MKAVAIQEEFKEVKEEKIKMGLMKKKLSGPLVGLDEMMTLLPRKRGCGHSWTDRGGMQQLGGWMDKEDGGIEGRKERQIPSELQHRLR